MDSLLSRRFRWFTGIMGGLGVLSTGSILTIVALKVTHDDPQVSGQAISGGMMLTLTVFVLWTVMYLAGFVYASFRKHNIAKLVRLSLLIVIVDGLMNIGLRVFELPLTGMSGIFGFFISFTIATCFLPWTVRQALLVAGVVLGINAVTRLTPINGGFEFGRLFQVLTTSFAVMPGIFIAWYRSSSRLRDSQFYFLQRRYGEVRRELTDARRIHESMFPAPQTTGEIRFTYRYQPMRQIGGDYLHINNCPNDDGSEDTLSVVVLDVTGHGIPAALTVNRLYGELSRLYAEDPCIDPGDVLALLNRYVRLTMASHAVFVTGLALKVDSSKHSMIYANAGHPPAFHMRADDSIDQLDSTTFLLGAVDDETFDSTTISIEFAAGDRFIAYTDGATEARNSEGKMLGIRGMQGILASSGLQAEGSWPATLLSHVDAFRNGPPDDDTLVIEIYRPVGTAASRRAGKQQETIADDAEPVSP